MRNPLFQILKKRVFFILKDGRGDWIWTNGPLLPKQVRYQAALRPDLLNFVCQYVWIVNEKYGFSLWVQVINIA